MSFESLMNKWQTLNWSLEALAALGAELRLRREGRTDDSRLFHLLQEVVECIEPGLLDGVDANQELAVLSLIQSSFRQGIDLLENPGRAPGWSYEDPVILEARTRRHARSFVASIPWRRSDRTSTRRFGNLVFFSTSAPVSVGSLSRRRAPGQQYGSLASTRGSLR
jgi:hypothetical protein